MRPLQLASVLLLLVLVPAAQAGGGADEDTQCSDDLVRLVCATAALDVDLECVLVDDDVTCAWSGNWSAAFRSEPGVSGEGEAPAWGSFTACSGFLCLGISIDYYASCAWDGAEGCAFTHPFTHQMGWTLEPGDCLEATIEMGVPATGSVPLGLGLASADAFATASDTTYVCREN